MKAAEKTQYTITPLPWCYKPEHADQNYREFGTIYSKSPKQMVCESAFTEDAEYIVRAVNSHAELLAALEALLKVCDEELDPKRTPEMRDARIAIAKARGQ